MSFTKVKGHGRLVPMRLTGVTYQVGYGIHSTGDDSKSGKGRAQWTTCSVHPPHARRIPDGGYFLYSEEGKIYQLRSAEGKWHYLAVAA